MSNDTEKAVRYFIFRFLSVLAQYEAVSFGNYLFQHFVLLPLQQQFSAQLRKAVWFDKVDVLRSLGLPLREVSIGLSKGAKLDSHLFQHFVLLPLQQQFSAQLRKAVWFDKVDILRSLGLPLREVSIFYALEFVNDINAYKLYLIHAFLSVLSSSTH